MRRRKAGVLSTSSTLSFRDDAYQLLLRFAGAGYSSSGCQLYPSTVRELDVAPDEWPATFNDVLGAS